MWWFFSVNLESGYKNFPLVANRKRNGEMLSAPLCYYDKKERELRTTFRYRIKEAWGGKPPLTGDIEVVYFFGVKVPNSWSQRKKEKALKGLIKPNVKPDLTNRLYWMENRMKGVVFGDDALVVDLSARGRYAKEPSVSVYVRTVPADEE